MFKKRKKPITEDKKTEQDALTIPPKDYDTTDFVASKPEPVNPNQFYTPAPTTEEQSLIPAVRPPAVQEPFYTPSATPEIVEQPLIPAVRPMTGQEPFYTPSTSPQPEEQTPQPATNLMAVRPPNAQERYDNAYNKRVDENGKFIDRDKGKGSALKNFFKGLGIGFLRGGLPGALASGVLNTAVGNLDEQWAWNNLHRPNLQGEVNREQQQQKERQQAEYEDARTQNIYADNEFQKERLKQQAEDKNRAFEQRKAEVEQKRKDAILAKYQKRPFFDASKATLAERAELESIGQTPENLGVWDRSKPDKHIINGVTFIWDNNSRTYKESGLPVDEEKRLVDFKTKDGATYRISAKTAATLQTQLDMLGIKQDFTRDENEKNRILRRQEMAENRRRFDEMMVLRKNAENNRNIAEVQRINTQIANAKANAKRAGYSDKEIAEMFPDQ